MKWPRIEAFVLAAGLCAAPAAQADEDKGGYLGGGIGQATASDYCSDDAGLVVTSCEDNDTSFKVYGGYHFTRNIGIEVAYVDLGTLSASGTFTGIPFDINTELTGVTVQAVGIAPLGDKFSLMGRVGAIFWDMSTSATLGGFPGTTSDDGVDLAVGVGAQFKLTPNFGIRADLDYYPNLGNDDTGEDNVAAVTIGIVFSF